MKYKIIAILISVLFLINLAAVATPISNTSRKIETTNFDDPVPIWEVGDTWTYTFNSFIVNYSYYDLKILINGRIDDFKWSVVDTSGTDYIIEFTGEITADSYEFFLPYSSTTLHVSGKVKPSMTSLSGSLVFTKSDLEMKDLSAQLKGIVFAKINQIPISIPIPFKITMDASLSTIFPIFDFPLYDDKFWAMNALDITSNINVGGMFGLITYPVTLTTSYSWIPFAFHCKPKVDVTVEAGTYSAYNIESTFFDVFDYYYAPLAGNLVKIDAFMPNGEAHGELKSTNFS